MTNEMEWMWTQNHDSVMEKTTFQKQVTSPPNSKTRQGRQGKSKGSRSNTRQKEQMSSDGFLEYTDEEEHVETALRTDMQTVFHKMLHGPGAEAQLSEDVVPSEILLVQR